MKERPLLFSGAMVRALLEGRKTQTRRLVKLPHNNPLGQWEPTTFGGTDARGVEHDDQAAIWHTRTGDTLGCPYGKLGDRLWVRETFKPIASGEVKNGYGEVRYGFAYQADSATRWADRPTVIHDLTGQPPTGPMQFKPTPWKPSIHMPRRACRIVLEITGVRVQRLQAIGVDDVFAEGVQIPADATSGNVLLDISSKFAPSKYLPKPDPSRYTLRGRRVGRTAQWTADLARAHFASLWDTINGADAWASNPWVWAITFKRVTP